MSFQTDAGGWAFKSSEWKLSLGASTWATRLSQLYRQTGKVRILTYSLPSLEYVQVQFDRRPQDIWLICHSKFVGRAREIKARYPGVMVAVNDEMHAKVLMIEPSTLWIGSANFGRSGWTEIMAGIRSKDGHDRCAETFDHLWSRSREVTV